MMGQYLAEMQLFKNLKSEGAKKSKYLENRLLSCPNEVLSYAYCQSKRSFDIFTVRNVQNIFTEHDLFLIS